MKPKMKLFSYGLALLVIVFLSGFVLRCFFDAMNNGLVLSLENTNSRLSGPFQAFKLLFFLVNLIGIITCIILLLKNNRKLNKYLLGIVLFNLFYSLVIFLWVINAAKPPEIQPERIASYLLNMSSGGSDELINFGIETATTSVLRQMYLWNMYDALIMAIPTLILIFIKFKVDKRIRNSEGD